jgi:hypothetical protein
VWKTCESQSERNGKSKEGHFYAPSRKPIKGEYNSQSQPVPSEEDYRTVDSTEVIEIEFSDDNVSMTDDPDIGPFASLALIQEIDYESQQGAESDIHNMSEAYGTISMTI